jgi:hypothetical protein
MVTAVEVEWPGGARERVTGVTVDRRITIEEGRGVQPGAPTAAR